MEKSYPAGYSKKEMEGKNFKTTRDKRLMNKIINEICQRFHLLSELNQLWKQCTMYILFEGHAITYILLLETGNYKNVYVSCRYTILQVDLDMI